MDQNQQPKPAGSAEKQGIDSLKKTAEDATATAKQHAQRAGNEIRDRATRAMDDARDTIVEESAAAKDTTAGELSRTARALQDAAGKLDTDESGHSQVPQSLLREAAGGLDELAQSLQGKSVGEMVGDFSDFGRRNPVAFMGAAALAGFALGRFARASERPAVPTSQPIPRAEPTVGAARSPVVAPSPAPATEPMAGRTSNVGGTTHG